MSDYQRRTITRLCRHVAGIEVEWERTEPAGGSGYYTVVVFSGVRARAHIADGFITFKVRQAVYCPSSADPGTAVVPVRKMMRRKDLLAAWFGELHRQAAKLRPVNSEDGRSRPSHRRRVSGVEGQVHGHELHLEESDGKSGVGHDDLLGTHCPDPTKLSTKQHVVTNKRDR